MRPLLHHDSSLEYSNAVCVLDGGQTVGHDDARPALAGLVQSLLHHLQREHGLIRAPTMNVFSTKDGFSLNQSCHLYQHGYFPVFLPSSSLMWTLSAQHFPQSEFVPIFLCVDFSCSSRLYELVTWLTIYLISLTSITGENGKMCSPSRSQCPAQKWPHPAAAVWGCGGWLGLWLFAASDHLTAVSPYHLPACHISAHGKNKQTKQWEGIVVLL